MQKGRAFLIKIQKIFSTGHHLVPVLFKAETKMTLKLCLYLVRMKHLLLKFSILLYVDCRFCHEKIPSTFSFVTMNKCFHVPFQTIKTGFWKKVGLHVCLIGHLQDDRLPLPIYSFTIYKMIYLLGNSDFWLDMNPRAVTHHPLTSCSSHSTWIHMFA